MALKDEQLMAIQHVFWQGCVCMAYTDGYSKYTCISSSLLYSCLASTLERLKQHIAITDLQATSCRCTLQSHIFPNISLYVLLSAGAYLYELYRECNKECAIIYFTEYFSVLFILCKFSLCILMNYTENVTELLAYGGSRGYQALLSDFL